MLEPARHERGRRVIEAGNVCFLERHRLVFGVEELNLAVSPAPKNTSLRVAAGEQRNDAAVARKDARGGLENSGYQIRARVLVANTEQIGTTTSALSRNRMASRTRGLLESREAQARRPRSERASLSCTGVAPQAVVSGYDFIRIDTAASG